MVVQRVDFAQVARNAFAGLGFPPELAEVTFPVDLFLVDSDLTPVRENIDKIVTGLTKWQPTVKEKSIITPPKVTVEGKDYKQAIANMNTLFLRNMWGDGLPLLPPTEESVKWILRGTDLSLDTKIGNIVPAGRIATVETLAVALAMAGGRPEYLPVLIASVQAVVDPAFQFQDVQASSGSRYVVVVVNGPIAKQIRLNSGWGLMGPDSLHPAGGSIGRALRLLQENVGGAVPGIGTMAQFSGMRYTNAVFAEDEAGLPPGWKPFNVQYLGTPKGTNTAAVFIGNGTEDITRRGTGKEPTLEEEALASLYEVAAYIGTPYYKGDEMAGAVVMPSVVAQQLADLGWTQEKIKAFLWENSKIPWAKIEQVWTASKIEDTLKGDPRIVRGEPMPITSKPENILLMVAGGQHPSHVYWIPSTWAKKVGGGEIKLPKEWDQLLKEAENELGPLPPQ